MTDNYDWDKLSETAEAGELQSIPGTTRRGEDAAASGRALLLESTDVDDQD